MVVRTCPHSHSKVSTSARVMSFSRSRPTSRMVRLHPGHGGGADRARCCCCSGCRVNCIGAPQTCEGGSAVASLSHRRLGRAVAGDAATMHETAKKRHLDFVAAGHECRAGTRVGGWTRSNRGTQQSASLRTRPLSGSAESRLGTPALVQRLRCGRPGTTWPQRPSADVVALTTTRRLRQKTDEAAD